MRNEDLDLLIDGALREYVAREPVAGIERRVMARMMGKMRPAHPQWFWLWAFAAVAAALVATIGLWEPVPPLPAGTPVVAVQEPPIPITVPERRVPEHRPTRAHRRGLPQLAQFPSPEPLTDGERALLRFIRSDHDQALAVLDARRVDREQPLITDELP